MTLSTDATTIILSIYIVFLIGASAVIVAGLLMRLLAVVLALFGVNTEG